MIIYFTVTNDLSYDQRMIRICTSLAGHGYKIKLVGRKIKNSIPVVEQPFQQKRIKCFFNKGKFFYAEYNVRLFFYLLFKKMDCICAIDLDTILPCYFISKIKNVPRIYDAHELFCEMKEIVTRPHIYAIWKKIEKFSVPKFIRGYTVNQIIADEFKKMYKVNYQVIRSIAVKREISIPVKKEKYILYQGAVNEGRNFETLIPAMHAVNAPLYIYGDGNFLEKAKKLVTENKLGHKIFFKGKIAPGQLGNITLQALVGVTLFDPGGLSNYYSLANRFFDYMHACTPQLCVDFPAYREINEQFEIAVLISDLSSGNIARHINILLEDETLYQRLQQNCMKARETFNWQNEEKKLIEFYKPLFNKHDL
ncbi:MAG: glycosyltransferase [Chitinophagaceae bacterium]|nr:glycosyltransferase [Chitinophagaceae bacterium]